MSIARQEIVLYITKNLSAKRVAHILEVEKSALCLAERFGADAPKTSTAALLHDIAKEYTPALLFEKAKEYDILIDEIAQQNPGLLHGPVGAHEARRIFGLQDEAIFEAIYYHSTLNSKVGLLAKVIFMADRIEATRDYKGVEEIRLAANESLDKAIVVALGRNMRHELKKYKGVHSRSLSAYNEIILRNEVRFE